MKLWRAKDDMIPLKASSPFKWPLRYFKLKAEGSCEIVQIDLNGLFIEHVCHRSKKPPQNEQYCLVLSAFYTILPKNMANRVKIFIDGKVVDLV